MIAVLICNCPNAEPKAYRFLQQHVENWMDVPVYRGTEQRMKFLRHFVDYPSGPESPHALSQFLSKVSRYIVVVAWTKDEFHWADIAHGSAKSEVDAKHLIFKFA